MEDMDIFTFLVTHISWHANPFINVLASVS
jgi:hypothetical protein